MLRRSVNPCDPSPRDIVTSNTAIGKLLKKKGIKRFKQRERNLIPMAQLEKRYLCCKALRQCCKETGMPKFLFVDECCVTVEQYFNPQNHRCFGKSFEVIFNRKNVRQFPKSSLSVMISGAFFEKSPPLLGFFSLVFV